MIAKIPLNQVLRFLVVGLITFALDYSTLVFLTEVVGLFYLLSAAIGFVFGSTINYVLSIKYVFTAGKFKKRYQEFLIFILFTALGLLLNQIAIFIGTGLIKLDYRISKIISLIIVTTFNYLTKKFIVFIK